MAKDMFKSDTFKLLLVICSALALQIVGIVRWSDILTPNWVGATVGHVVLAVANAFGISLVFRLPTQRGNQPLPPPLLDDREE